ncbi:MAG: DegQ family serine endoprotease [Candidatus Omnitrophica bacterium]|nr:DegQ family serine endoprotease [Candidatus Omnitrophota bacterium]
MFKSQQGKIKIWLLALTVGVAAGLLLAVRLNILAPSKAESEIEVKASPSINAEALENDFVRVAKEVGPAVVSISAEHTEKVGPRSYFQFFGNDGDEFNQYFDQFFKDFFGEMPQREYKQKGLGSGFIIDEEGYILTNQHVVENADKITVTLPDGRRFDAELKGSDSRSDLAVIKIEAKHLPVLKLGNSDQVKIGQWAIAVGNPFGFAVGSAEPTVTAGIISALNRSLPQTYQRNYTDLIQTDAAINPGNSGGPLVNIKGEVIGINVAIFSPSGGNIGIGFAIPVNTANDILARLIAGKKVLYGWLGITIQDLNEELAGYFKLPDQQGALVLKVLENSPAAKAGFKEGDVIRKFSGQPVQDVRSLLREVNKTEVGKTVPVEVIREQRTLTLRVEIGERPEDIDELMSAAQAQDSTWRGMEVSEINADLARRYRIKEQEAVVIISIEPKSPASLAGLLAGDVILAINNQRIKSLKDYEQAIKSVPADALIRTERGFAVVKKELAGNK